MQTHLPEESHSAPVHGGLDSAELKSLGLCPEEVLDFSASIHPLGAAPEVAKALTSLPLDAYPDRSCLELRQALGKRLEIRPESILVGNGSTELIHLIARAFLRPGGTAVIFAPTFAEYAAACRTEGVLPSFISSHRQAKFRWDLPDALNRISDLRPSLVFVCNPNNPTGIYLRKEEVRQISESVGDGGLLVLDEAYRSFVEDRWRSQPLLRRGNVALLRSMTKDYALAGLRLGYLLASEAVIGRVGKLQYSWSLNAAAQAAGRAALDRQQHLERGRRMVSAGKDFLRVSLTEMGLECLPSAANFLLIRVGEASRLRLELLKRYKLCVRDCSSFGLPDYIRVAVRNIEDSRRLVQALQAAGI
jgi:histidinol-phosphate aminotransferase